MRKIERRFKNGEIIFHEGEPSSTAFVIVEGEVELTKEGPAGGVVLATLPAGEMFGEMGIVGGSADNPAARSATARAVGEVVLDVVDREVFLNSLKQRPDVALSVIGNLAERLRRTNEKIVGPGAAAAVGAAHQPTTVPQAVSTGLVDLIMQLRKRRGLTLQIRLARLANDGDGSQTGLTAQAFAKRKGIKLKITDEPVAADPRIDMGAQFAAAARAGRLILEAENADLVIWGGVNDSATAVHYRFISAIEDDDHPGGFLITDRLTLPVNFNPELGDLLAAVALAATVPRSDAHRHQLRSQLLLTLEAVQESGQQPPTELVAADQASIQICYGNVCALIGYFANDHNWSRKGADAYRSALELLDQNTAPAEWAGAHRHLAVVLQVLGERGGDAEILTTAAAAYKTAAEVFTRGDFPFEWAAIQARLGNTLYKIDLADSDAGTLEDAIAALQSALQVFSRAATPLRWGDAKNNLGQALQVWGDLGRSPETLARAAAALRDALTVRSAEAVPLLWAASQNNLGSALFMLGRLTEDAKHIESAADAFGKALGVYRAQGAQRFAAVTRRNKDKAEDMLDVRGPGGNAARTWADEGLAERFLPAPQFSGGQIVKADLS